MNQMASLALILPPEEPFKLQPALTECCTVDSFLEDLLEVIIVK